MICLFCPLFVVYLFSTVLLLKYHLEMLANLNVNGRQLFMMEKHWPQTGRERVTERVSVQNKTNANGFLEACVINTPEKKNKAKKRTEQSNCNDQQHNALYLSCSMLCGDVNWSAFFLSATKCVTLVLRFALCSECFWRWTLKRQTMGYIERDLLNSTQTCYEHILDVVQASPYISIRCSCMCWAIHAVTLGVLTQCILQTKHPVCPMGLVTVFVRFHFRIKKKSPHLNRFSSAQNIFDT